MECTIHDYKRARARQILFHLLGRRPDAMRQWLKKRLSELLYARARLKCLCLSIPEHTQHYPEIYGTRSFTERYSSAGTIT